MSMTLEPADLTQGSVTSPLYSNNYNWAGLGVGGHIQKILMLLSAENLWAGLCINR